MDFRTRLEQGRERRVDTDAALDPEETFVSEYFATDRVKAYPVCLELRLLSGKRQALPYSYFTEMTYDVETGIEVFSNSKKIRITGRNLSELFDSLINYRVRYVQANVGNDRQEDGLFVKEIVIEDLTLL